MVADCCAAYDENDHLAALRRFEREAEQAAAHVGLHRAERPAQVGGELGISEITVKAHRGQVMRKLTAGSLADL